MTKDAMTKMFENFISDATNRKIAEGKYVISDIRDNGCDLMTVIRYRVDNVPKKMVVTTNIFVPGFY